MKWFAIAALLVAVVVVVPSSTVGQQAETTDGQQTENDDSESSKDLYDGRRLPPGYSEIITVSQRRRIYQIQEQYQGQIDELVKQIESIEAKRDAEVQAILDDQQRQVLQFILQIRERNRAEAEVAAKSSDVDAGADAGAGAP